MCVDMKTGIKTCSCGDTCGKELSQEKLLGIKQERYHEYIKRMYQEDTEMSKVTNKDYEV
jgi:hypothetical protein